MHDVARTLGRQLLNEHVVCSQNFEDVARSGELSQSTFLEPGKRTLLLVRRIASPSEAIRNGQVLAEPAETFSK